MGKKAPSVIYNVIKGIFFLLEALLFAGLIVFIVVYANPSSEHYRIYGIFIMLFMLFIYIGIAIGVRAIKKSIAIIRSGREKKDI